MKVPESPLGVCRQRSCCCIFCKFMTAQRIILENESDLLGIFLEQLLEYRREPGTVRSLKIGKNRHHHCCAGRSLYGRPINWDLMNEIQFKDLDLVAGGVN